MAQRIRRLPLETVTLTLCGGLLLPAVVIGGVVLHWIVR